MGQAMQERESDAAQQTGDLAVQAETEWERMGRLHKDGEPEPGLWKRYSHFASHMDALMGRGPMGRCGVADGDSSPPPGTYSVEDARTRWRWATHSSGQNLARLLSAAGAHDAVAIVDELTDRIWAGDLSEKQGDWPALGGRIKAAVRRAVAARPVPHGGLGPDQPQRPRAETRDVDGAAAPAEPESDALANERTPAAPKPTPDARAESTPEKRRASVLARQEAAKLKARVTMPVVFERLVPLMKRALKYEPATHEAMNTWMRDKVRRPSAVNLAAGGR